MERCYKSGDNRCHANNPICRTDVENETNKYHE